MRSRRVPKMMAALSSLLVMGCGDLLKATNPGPILGPGLDEPSAAPGVVNGISYDLSYNLNGAQENDQSNVIQLIATVAEETYNTNGEFSNNGHIILALEDIEWSGLAETGWVAEHGVTTLQKSLGSGYQKSLLAARANLLTGIADRYLGETSCQAVIDGGPAQDRSVYFQRAQGYFTAAITIDQAAGDTSYLPAAYGGRAAVRAWQNDWAGAVADAAHVPTSFEYDALFNGVNLINNMAAQTHLTFDFTVVNTPWVEDSLDPRTPSTLLGVPTTDGTTPMQQQNKYTSNNQPVPLVHGTEMRLLEAENALLNGDIGGAFTGINDERAFYGLAPLAAPADLASAWATLQHERGAVLWLEGRRLWDLSRWFSATGAEHNDLLNGRDTCLPIGLSERHSNPNLN